MKIHRCGGPGISLVEEAFHPVERREYVCFRRPTFTVALMYHLPSVMASSENQAAPSLPPFYHFPSHLLCEQQQRSTRRM